MINNAWNNLRCPAVFSSLISRQTRCPYQETLRALFRINQENCQPSLYVKERLRVPGVPSRSFFEQFGVEFSLTPKFDRLPSRFANFLLHEIKRPRNEFSDENPVKMEFISS